VPPFKLKYRNLSPDVIRRAGRPIQNGSVDGEYNYDWACNDFDEPYTTSPNKPFTWQGRIRITGGRTNVWGRHSYRFSDLDFKAASRDGYGVDWPLTYKDLAPYYDTVEEYVGISGSPEGVYELPDGKFQPPMAMTCVEALFRDRIKKKLGRTMTMGRCANVTQPTNGRAPCHYCAPCWHGCMTHSYFNSFFTTVADALKTGRCDLISNAMVYKVLHDPEHNRARGLLYIDRLSHKPKEIYGRAVALCAQSLESARILLNSATRQYPKGLANSSGALGHYLMDHITGGGATGEYPELPGKAVVLGGAPHRPIGPYVIRFRNAHTGPREKNFIRGYGFQAGGHADFNWAAPGFGDEYKRALQAPIVKLGMGAFGECLGRWDNYVEINPNVVDTFGIPVLNIHMSYGENELAMVKDMAVSAAEMLEAAGAKNVQAYATPGTPGGAIHEVGVARMGIDPKTSVLNGFQQAHDIRNLFVMDGAGFPSSACQNPTLTIMALCVRSCDYLMEEMRKGAF
jgi:choline dehydrogenase-like flavoprotein